MTRFFSALVATALAALAVMVASSCADQLPEVSPAANGPSSDGTGVNPPTNQDGTSPGATSPATPQEPGTAADGPNGLNKPSALGNPDDPHPLPTAKVSASAAFQAKLDRVTPASEAEVGHFLRSRCAACHASGGPNASFWTLNFDEATKSVIRTDPDAHVAFQAIVNTVEGFSKPKSMPPGVDLTNNSDLETEFLRVIEWYVTEAPEVAIAAYLEYQLVNPFGEDVKVTFDYQCPSPVKFKTYLARFTLDALGRYPTEEDYALFTQFGYNREDIVTEAMRKEVARAFMLYKPWRTQFIEKGLRNFAHKLSGAAEIEPSSDPSEVPGGGDDVLKAGLTKEEAADLREELYQLIKGNIDPETGAESRSYLDLLMGNTIPVTRATAKLYQCNVNIPSGERWGQCEMNSSNPLRESYFTSFSYLASKPTSFLDDNNNYGRIATLYFFIRGQTLKAATDGPKGGNIAPLPDCLESKDTRGHRAGDTFAPIGTIQIPYTGNVCQSCHLDRNLANGSIVFRPFGSWGQHFSAEDFRRADVLSIPNAKEALNADRRRVSDPQDASFNAKVDAAFLASLLPDSSGNVEGEQACVTSDNSSILVNSVKDLARTLIGDGREIPRGMARHIPRGVSNINSTNSELVQEMEEAYFSNGGKLMPLFQAYFASETFACGNQEGN